MTSWPLTEKDISELRGKKGDLVALIVQHLKDKQRKAKK